jgi:hypothetical protein
MRLILSSFTDWAGSSPLLTLIIGATVLVFVGYINWYKNVKGDAIRWIAATIYRKGFHSESLADGLFMTAQFLISYRRHDSNCEPYVPLGWQLVKTK